MGSLKTSEMRFIYAVLLSYKRAIIGKKNTRERSFRDPNPRNLQPALQDKTISKASIEASIAATLCGTILRYSYLDTKRAYSCGARIEDENGADARARISNIKYTAQGIDAA